MKKLLLILLASSFSNSGMMRTPEGQRRKATTQCYICGEPKNKALALHLMKEHKICPTCKQGFESFDAVFEHFTKKHPNVQI